VVASISKIGYRDHAGTSPIETRVVGAAMQEINGLRADLLEDTRLDSPVMLKWKSTHEAPPAGFAALAAHRFSPAPEKNFRPALTPTEITGSSASSNKPPSQNWKTGCTNSAVPPAGAPSPFRSSGRN
jgi:hypothetical protein